MLGSSFPAAKVPCWDKIDVWVNFVKRFNVRDACTYIDATCVQVKILTKINRHIVRENNNNLVSKGDNYYIKNKFFTF